MGGVNLNNTKIYLDNCCYNRPYDDQRQLRIELETKAKLFIQQQVIENKLVLVNSVILEYENNMNPYELRKTVISDFLQYASEYVDKSNGVTELAREFSQKGLKTKDASHLACAIYAKCDYLITTDDRFLRYKDERIRIISPVDFLFLEGANP
jgi:predicted nucleic acid-binding protein